MGEACCVESTSKKREVDTPPSFLMIAMLTLMYGLLVFSCRKRLIFNLAALGILFQELHDAYVEVGANIIGP